MQLARQKRQPRQSRSSSGLGRSGSGGSCREPQSLWPRQERLGHRRTGPGTDAFVRPGSNRGLTKATVRKHRRNSPAASPARMWLRDRRGPRIRETATSPPRSRSWMAGIGTSRLFAACGNTAEVGGEADTPRTSLDRRDDPEPTLGGNPAMQRSPAAPGVLSFGAAAQARVQ